MTRTKEPEITVETRKGMSKVSFGKFATYCFDKQQEDRAIEKYQTKKDGAK